MSALKFAAATGAVGPIYVEDVFSTHTYTGTNAAQTINNGIDLAGKGGLVWTKARDGGPTIVDHQLMDTVRGLRYAIHSNLTNANFDFTADIVSATSNGFTLTTASRVNQSAGTYVSWTFRKQPKFFDVVTYTGDNTANRQIAHSLGSAPGMIIIKMTSGVHPWWVWHRSVTAQKYLVFNTTAGEANIGANWNQTATHFTASQDLNANNTGETYVAYLFAHNAGGFGLTGTDNVISCGSYTTDESGLVTLNLGWEPQYLLMKPIVATNGQADNWMITDTARGFFNGSESVRLRANDTIGDSTSNNLLRTAQGFDLVNNIQPANTKFIYIAIRRGPMKVPTVGTSVYNAIARTGTGAAATVTGVGFAPDFVMGKNRGSTNPGLGPTAWQDRLRGVGVHLTSNATQRELADTLMITAFGMDGVSFGTDANYGYYNWASESAINWFFKRAPGFFDEVCYTGIGSTPQNIAHNLAAPPELWFVKQRSTPQGWCVGSSHFANTGILALQTDAEMFTDPTAWNSTYPTSSVLTVGSLANVNENTKNFVAYLFATCPGVSKVGSYAGTGTTNQINCGFTAGARFVLIKCTAPSNVGTGDWYVWDSVRGIIAGNDPYLLLNSTAAEVTGTDYIDTYSAGFELSSSAPAALNALGRTYIFLAIA